MLQLKQVISKTVVVCSVAALAVLALIFFIAPGLIAKAPLDQKAKNIVNVYSYRQPFLIEPLFELFEKETGIIVNVLFAKSGLIERVALEGRASPADILLTTDIGQMFQAAESIGRAVRSPIIKRNVPSQYRDPRGFWFALTKRARAIFVAEDEDEFDDISYEDLGRSELNGKICIRDGRHAYNIGLIAAMIAHHGSKKARLWLKGMKKNLARRPSGNDRLQIKGVFSGECDIAIANTYYMGKMITNKANLEQRSWAQAVKIIFPRFNIRGGGTHINLSGMVLMRFAPHKGNALKLMEFLTQPKAQAIYARDNFEFPINPNIASSKRVRSWDIPRDDRLTPEQIANHRSEASLLVDETNFND